MLESSSQCRTSQKHLHQTDFFLRGGDLNLGQDMKAIGQDMEVSKTAGINVEKTRIIAIVISTVLAGFGQIIYLQNIGTMNTYNSHEQIGMFSIAALLVGGASASRATIFNVISGIFLFHMLFIVSPMAGKELMGSAQIGEYFRVFVSYGVIALTLVLHQWRREKEKNDLRKRQMEKRMKRIEDSLRDLCDNIKCTNIRIIGVPEEEEKREPDRKSVV